ncbi:hypothetical protein BDR26DRAFT_1011402 [Obelidium mucronatum]|nr:hypothetical protein BDR26DRAFT_1011402 [Obelidium mucronatum]
MKLDALMASLSEFGFEDDTSNSSQHRLSTDLDLRRQSRRSSIGSGSYKRTSRSVARADQAISQIVTLGVLQDDSATLSGFLYKLTSEAQPPTRQQQYKLRYFVLSHTGNLHIFKSNNNPNAIPITFLPLTSCTAHTESGQNYEKLHIMRVHGDGVNAEGVLVKRQWTLKFPDEDTLVFWTRTIQRILSSKHEQPATSSTKTTINNQQLSSELPRASVDFVRPSMDQFRPFYNNTPQTQSPPPQRKSSIASPLVGARSNSIGSSLSGHSHFSNPSNYKRSSQHSNEFPLTPPSLSGTTSAQSIEATQHSMHQDYIIRQRAAAERFKQELILKKEAEEKKQVELEIQKIKSKELEIADQEMYARQAANPRQNQGHQLDDARAKAERMKASMGL